LAAATRALRWHAAGVRVLLRGGDYVLPSPLQLSEADGGAPLRPVTYSSYPGERARLLGGLKLPHDAFRQVTGHSRSPTGLLVLDLRACGVHSSAMLGGSSGVGSMRTELLVDQQGRHGGSLRPLQLAQDPNPFSNGTWVWAGFNDISAVGTSGHWFVLDATAPHAHLAQWRAAVNLSLYGHWSNDYGDMRSVRVLSMEPLHCGADNHSVVIGYNITLASNIKVQPGQRFVAIDALQLVDVPGEYYIDREQLRLYVSPPLGNTDNRSYILSIYPSLPASEKASAALVQLQGASHIRFENLTIAASAQSLFAANGSNGLEIVGCDFSVSSGDCVSVTMATNSQIQHSTISHCGGTGLTLTGGIWYPGGGESTPWSTPTLPKELWLGANVSLVDSHVYRWARWMRIPNHPAILWSGCGHSIRGCRLENGPSPAVLNQGSMDFLFESNEISNCPYEYNDMGAYYHGGSAGGYQFGWTQTNNTIRNNTFRSIKFVLRAPQTDGFNFTLNGLTTQAIYLDDGHSGYHVVGNRFQDVEMGIVLGGGRRHTVVNNTFYSCLRACVHIDNRGENWAHELCGCQCSFGTCKPGCVPGPSIGPGLNTSDWMVLNTSNVPGVHGYPPFRFEQGVRKLRCAGIHASPPCTTRLPWLAGMLDDATGGGLCAPAHNLVTNNTFVTPGCTSPWQLCGFVRNASDFTLECSLHRGADLDIVAMWGSNATGNHHVRRSLKTDDITLTADTPWVVSPAESDAVAAVIGRPVRHLQPNNMKPHGKGCGSDIGCRNVGPFRQAQVRSDLGQDAYKVLGAPPVLLPEPPSPEMVRAGEAVLFLGTATAAPWLLQLFPALAAHDGCVDGTWEEHCVRSFDFGNGSAIVATGTGDRGAIFAAYELSHELLGVSPVWYWSGRQPAYRGSVSVALPLNLTFGRPDYKYRALFPNDEDLLAGHFADPEGQTVISVEPWSRLCETALRLKANTIQAGTVSYPDESIVAVSARRGLVLTASHFNLVGSNTYRWPLELSALPNQGWDWRKDPQSMAHLWKASIDAQKDLGEVLWSVGLRGVTDADYTACGSNKTLCAEITNEVVSNMTSWIRDAQGADAPIIWFLFGGAAELMAAGLLRPPPGVWFLASDNYPHIGVVNAVPPKLTSGVYYHAAWMSTYTSQLAEMVPPVTFYSQLEKYRSTAKSTDVFVLNVSDLLPVLMAAELIMKYLWSRTELEQAPSIAVAQTNALTAWAAREYTDGNQTLAAEVTLLLERYYELVLVPDGKSWTPLHGNSTVGDVWLANLTRAMSWCAMNVLPDKVDMHCDMVHLTTESITSIAKQVRTSPVVPLLWTLHADTKQLASRLDAVGSSGAGFFKASVGLRHSMFANLWTAAVATANAIESYTHSNRSISSRQAGVAGNASLAESAFQRIFACQRTAEAATGFRGMYANDKLSDIHRSRRVVRQLGEFLLSLLDSKPPGLKLVSLEDTGQSLYQFYDYQTAVTIQRSYPLLHRSSRWNLYRLVRVSCALNQTNSECHTSVDGGWFRGTARIVMDAIDQCPIRFEMGVGTRPPAQPTVLSKLYTQPIEISQTSSFKAALACRNESVNVWLVSSLTFIAADKADP
jgi:hypothetical protein